ncbi:MAG: hypothetical protein M3R27_06030, partial [Bacteroidota bacterium]|nr:hypothetical protein [Bacteroidota bacterium]
MRYLILFFTFLSTFSFAQLSDNFSDGDFTSSPVWSGDNADWTVVSGQLRSNSSVASYGFYLSTP